MTQVHETSSPIVVIADDDPDDSNLVVDAWHDARPGIEMRCVRNGQELLDLLEQMADEARGLPVVVLLDLNMPMVDGWAALTALKQHATLRSVPIVVFTTSAVPEHVHAAYDMQAAGFVTKPSSYREFMHIVACIDEYWLTTVTTPSRDTDQ